MSVRIGIDVGGTFTDFVLVREAQSGLVSHKVPSTPKAPEAAVHRGLKELLVKASVSPSDVALVVHGTTISLNALIQRRGARVAVVVSPGNRDLLELGRLKLANGFDFFARPEDRLASRDLVLEIPARLDADGTKVAVPGDTDFDDIAARIRESDAVAVAVVLINAQTRPEFERWVTGELTRRLPGMATCASTDVWLDIREYERGMTAVMNAYVAPVMDQYYGRLFDIFRDADISAPMLITANNGGTIDLDTARRRPIETMLSGPAAGVVAAIDAARNANIQRIVTFDMGGTSADIAIAENDLPEITTRTLIGQMPLILPVVNVTAIGAGGGSIIRVDSEGVLKVGPNSAGADPGPVCYAKGGTDLTITDCYLACGFLDPKALLGGSLALSEDAALAAVDRIASAMAIAGNDRRGLAAEAALKVASSMMGGEIRKLLARRGCDPRQFTLMPYGGAGPTHAAMVAEEAGIERILIPATPGLLCALGGILADLRRDFSRPCKFAADARGALGEQAAMQGLLNELMMQAKDWLSSLGGLADDWRFEVSADMRYPDQAYDLTVRLSDFAPGDDIGPPLAGHFHADHLRLYAFNEPESGISISRIVLTAIGMRDRIVVKAAASDGPSGTRIQPAFFKGAWLPAQRIRRQSLSAGKTQAGPLIVEQTDTTIVVPPGWRLEPLESGSLLLIRDESGAAE